MPVYSSKEVSWHVTPKSSKSWMIILVFWDPNHFKNYLLWSLAKFYAEGCVGPPLKPCQCDSYTNYFLNTRNCCKGSDFISTSFYTNTHTNTLFWDQPGFPRRNFIRQLAFAPTSSYNNWFSHNQLLHQATVTLKIKRTWGLEDLCPPKLLVSGLMFGLA